MKLRSILLNALLWSACVNALTLHNPFNYTVGVSWLKPGSDDLIRNVITKSNPVTVPDEIAVFAISFPELVVTFEHKYYAKLVITMFLNRVMGSA